jgi:transposase-like protein
MATKKGNRKGGRKRRYPNRSKRYGADFKLKAVKLLTEERVPVSLIRKECGISTETAAAVRDRR